MSGHSELSFGEAEMDGTDILVTELTITELFSLVQFIPNVAIFARIATELGFEEGMPVITEESSNIPGFDGDIDNPQMQQILFDNVLGKLIDMGTESLVSRGLLAKSESGVMTHKSLSAIIGVLESAVENINYRLYHSDDNDERSQPILKSAIYGLQSLGGDWLIAEHFGGQQHIRVFVVPSGTPLSITASRVISEGIKRSVSDNTYLSNGTTYSPFTLILMRGNQHQSSLIAAAQRYDNTWYTPYVPEHEMSIIGATERSFGNYASPKAEVMSFFMSPIGSIDIRNGLDGWEPLGPTETLLTAVDEFTTVTLHSDADHIPDHIPDELFR